jgi:hypothetical protein
MMNRRNIFQAALAGAAATVLPTPKKKTISIDFKIIYKLQYSSRDGSYMGGRTIYDVDEFRKELHAAFARRDNVRWCYEAMINGKPSVRRF